MALRMLAAPPARRVLQVSRTTRAFIVYERIPMTVCLLLLLRLLPDELRAFVPRVLPSLPSRDVQGWPSLVNYAVLHLQGLLR